jgi:hypothetical protein
LPREIGKAFGTSDSKLGRGFYPSMLLGYKVGWIVSPMLGFGPFFSIAPEYVYRYTSDMM